MVVSVCGAHREVVDRVLVVPVDEAGADVRGQVIPNVQPSRAAAR